MCIYIYMCIMITTIIIVVETIISLVLLYCLYICTHSYVRMLFDFVLFHKCVGNLVVEW